MRYVVEREFSLEDANGNAPMTNSNESVTKQGPATLTKHLNKKERMQEAAPCSFTEDKPTIS